MTITAFFESAGPKAYPGTSSLPSGRDQVTLVPSALLVAGTLDDDAILTNERNAGAEQILIRANMVEVFFGRSDLIFSDIQLEV